MATPEIQNDLSQEAPDALTPIKKIRGTILAWILTLLVGSISFLYISKETAVNQQWQNRILESQRDCDSMQSIKDQQLHQQTQRANYYELRYNSLINKTLEKRFMEAFNTRIQTDTGFNVIQLTPSK